MKKSLLKVDRKISKNDQNFENLKNEKVDGIFFGSKKNFFDQLFFRSRKNIFSTQNFFDLEKIFSRPNFFLISKKKISISKKFQTHFRDLRFLKFEILGPHFLKILRFLKFQTKIKKIVHIQISQDFFCDPGW